MRATALGLLALALAGTAAGAGSARPTLTIRDTSPLTVHGAHFQSRELVTLTVAYRGRHEKRVRATTAGTFTTRFRLSIGDCDIYRVSARGSTESRALYRSPIPECANPP